MRKVKITNGAAAGNCQFMCPGVNKAHGGRNHSRLSIGILGGFACSRRYACGKLAAAAHGAVAAPHIGLCLQEQSEVPRTRTQEQRNDMIRNERRICTQPMGDKSITTD